MIDYFTDELLETAKKIGKRLKTEPHWYTTSNIRRQKLAPSGNMRILRFRCVISCVSISHINCNIYVALKLNLCEMSATNKGDRLYTKGQGAM